MLDRVETSMNAYDPYRKDGMVKINVIKIIILADTMLGYV